VPAIGYASGPFARANIDIDSLRIMRLHPALLFAGMLLISGSPAAFERDVHFGLTKWLALQAGFTAQQAEALATGTQRVDSGDMQFIEVVATYACIGKDPESAAATARHHYPSAGRVPGPPEQRAVIAGSDAARQMAIGVTKVSQKQSGFMLYKFGEGIHALQDSWSHQGAPDVPQMLGGAIACDPTLVFGHPRSRGGWNSHKADLTHAWPADTLAMASATYELLLQYPPIGDEKRSPKQWTQIRPSLDGFIRAATKSQKKKWFVEQGISDVSFLEGISLPDGMEPFDAKWEAHKLPPLSTIKSTQHHVDAELLEFFNEFFLKWVSTDDFDALAREFAAAPGKSPAKGSESSTPMDKVELANRLRVWRIRDHGRVADIAHSSTPLSSQQRNALSSIAKNRDAVIRYASPTEAFFPVTVKGPEPSPLLGFVINTIAKSAAGDPRAVAITKFRHAPYDTLVVLAERIDGRWRIVSLGATVDH
jgi:hypothetical protein